MKMRINDFTHLKQVKYDVLNVAFFQHYFDVYKSISQDFNRKVYL